MLLNNMFRTPLPNKQLLLQPRQPKWMGLPLQQMLGIKKKFSQPSAVAKRHRANWKPWGTALAIAIYCAMAMPVGGPAEKGINPARLDTNRHACARK